MPPVSDTAGSLLLRSGLVSEEQVRDAELLVAQGRGTIGECLVRLGAIDEESVVDFFHRRLMVPRIEPERFERISKKTLAAVPAEMAAEFHIFPIEIDAEGTITLAMADPSDASVADEVGFFTDRFCQRAVAHASLIRAAIKHYYGVDLDEEDAPEPTVELPPGVFPEEYEAGMMHAHASNAAPTPMPRLPESGGLDEQPDDLDLPPPEESDEADAERAAEEPVLLLTRRKQPTGEEPTTRFAVQDLEEPTTQFAARDFEEAAAGNGASADETLHGPPSARSPHEAPPTRAPEEPPSRAAALPPALGPTDDDDFAEPILLTRPVARVTPRTPSTLTGIPVLTVPDPPLGALRSTTTRDEIAETLLQYLGQMVPRAALFVVRRGVLMGHGGRGAQLDADAVRQVQIPVDAPSLFRDAVQSRLPYRGPLLDSPVDRAFADLIGELRGDVMLFPVSVRERVVALLYADGITHPLPDAVLHAVAREAGRAYERLILEGKR